MNNFLRLVGLLSVVLLAACDADKPPVFAPVAKVASVPAEASAPVADAPKAAVDTVPFPVVVPAAPFKQLEREPVQPVHDMAPNVPVVSVVATTQSRSGEGKVGSVTKSSAKASSNVTTAKANPNAADVKARAPIASKTKPAKQVVEQTRLTKPSLDLSLPEDMVNQLRPVGKVAPIIHKGVLPQMFSEKKSDKDGPFQLNGRLLSNEMQLQRRDEDHHGVEGAALDFEFKQ